VTPLTFRVLESPGEAGTEAAAALAAGPGGNPDEWLLLLAAVLYSRPELVTAVPIGHLEGLLRDGGVAIETRRAAGEALALAVPGSSGEAAVAAALSLLRESPPSARTAAMDALRAAVFWAIERMDAEALVAAAEASPDLRAALVKDAIEPVLLASEAAAPELLDRAAALYGDADASKYLAYFLTGKAHPRFACHAAIAERLGHGRRRVLMAHNIDDGQGDEIVRTAALAQALVDFNPELEIVLVTRRLHLYAHPRIETVPIGDRARVRDSLRGAFDAVFDFFEPDIQEVDYDPELERAVEDLRARHRTFLDVRSRKGFNHFLFEGVSIDGRAVAGSLGLDRRRVANNYEPAMRLIAELGLPLRRGEAPPRTEPILAGVQWPEADRYWDRLTKGSSRPVALLAPFGGAEALKGFTGLAGIAAEIRRLIGEGWRVVAMPTGASWGSTRTAEAAIALLPAEQREFAAVGPAPDSEAEGIPAQAPLSFADATMRLTLYGIRRADLVVSVEGWMVHAAHAFGKPYRILMLPYSHGGEWLPYGRTRRQGGILTAGQAEESGLLLEHPRKQRFLLLMRECGRSATAEALPCVRRALSSPDRHIRLVAAETLAAHRGPEIGTELAGLLLDPAHGVRAAAAQAILDRGGTPAPREELLAHVWIGPMERNWGSILRLGAAARRAIETAAQGDDPVVRRESVWALRVLDFKAVPAAAGDTRKGNGLSKLARLLRRSKDDAAKPKILILTPVKDAEAFIPGYYQRIARLTYPGRRISLGFLESDSQDATYAELKDRLPRLRKQFRRAEIWKKDFGYRIPDGSARWAEHVQGERRSVLAKSRNHLLFHALDDEDWVLWLDVDVIEYPADIIERLLAAGKDIVQPHCVLEYGGPSFDQNAWRDHGKLLMQHMRDEGELVELHAVGGTMLFVRADAHREGLIFPPAPYGIASGLARERGELETEGLGIMAREMGYRCWGMPHLEIKHGKW
jgi:hypothetical protein